MAAPRQATKNCIWGPNCPICEEDWEHGEGWDGNLQTHQECCSQMHNNPSHRAFSILIPKTSIHRMLSSPSCRISSAPSPNPAAPLATKHSVLPITEQPAIIWHSWQIHRTYKMQKRMGRENRKTEWKI